MIIELCGNISLYDALDKANDNDILILENKEYKEKITLSKKNITLIGRENTIISYSSSHGDINPLTKKEYGTTGSSVFRVLNICENFNVKNITFKNTFIRDNKPDGQAVAFKMECNGVIENCNFISQQDTLYLDQAKNIVVNNSYIEGDIDFIFGSANAYFNNCKIVSVANKLNLAYVTAPSTIKSNEIGFVFDNCQFASPSNITSYLGRAWYPGGASEDVEPKLLIKNSSFCGNYINELITMHEGDPVKQSLQLENNIYNK